MPIPLSCPCGRSFKLKDELAGRKVRCPACRRVLAVPRPEREVDPDDQVLEALPADFLRRLRFRLRDVLRSREGSGL
jgi:hypothetical protein